MIEGILQGLVSNGLTKLTEKLFDKDKSNEVLIKNTEISIDCTSNYIDYLLSGDESFTDIEIGLTNNTSNSLNTKIEIIHAEIDGPPLGPFSSPYVVSYKQLFDKNSKRIIIKPFSEKKFLLQKFTSTAQRTLKQNDIIKPYPNLPNSEFMVVVDEKKYVSTLAGFYPPFPSKYSYKGVGLVLKVSVELNNYLVIRTLYGGFAKRSPDSKLKEIQSMIPTYYQFLSGIFDSGIILIEKNGVTDAHTTKTQITNHNAGTFNFENGYDYFSVMIKNNTSPCGAPIDIVLPSKAPVSENIDYWRA